MGKAKYVNIRKANKKAVFKSSAIVNFVPYLSLSKYINQLDNITDLHDNPAEGLKGCYRNPPQHILRLASFYLRVDSNRVDKLKIFTKCLFRKIRQQFFTFHFANKGDGAPGSGTSILVTFVNVGKRIASSKENFLLFGGNVDETSLPVINFFSKLIIDIKYLESQVFDILGKLSLN